MGADNKTSKVTPQTAAQVEAETQDEIAEIMSEIENLQQGLADAQKTKAPAKLKAVPTLAEPTLSEPASEEGESGSGLEEFRGSGDEPSLEDTLGEMKSEETAGGSLLDASGSNEEMETLEEEESGFQNPAQEQEEEVVMSNASKGDGDSALTMTLNGSMTLKLKYECDGQEVTISFVDSTLQVRLADGTEFKMPVNRSASRVRKVA